MKNNEKKQNSQSQFRKKQNNFPGFGKVPPQAIDFEEVVLGACMLERDAYLSIGHILSPDFFYKEAHQKIFQAIELLSTGGEPIDILTVTNKIKELGNLEIVGGAFYISQLTNRISSSVNIEYYAMILYQKYIQRELIRLSSEIISYAYDDNGFDEAVMAYTVATDQIDSLLAGKRAEKDMKQVMKDHEDELLRRIKMKSAGEMTGIKTGIVRLNKVTNGWKPGELIIVAGRPGMGKTAVALNLFTKQSAKLGKKTLFFSLEMDDISLADRLVCSYGGINADNLKRGDMENAELNKYYEAKADLEKLPIYIDDSARVDINHITTVSRAKHRKGECDMIVIDYLQLIEIQQQGYYNKTREREVSEMSRALKLLAKELKVPVMLLAQLNRAVETRSGDKRPQLGDLRESGAIEQDADMVIFPYRPEYYGLEEDAAGNSLENVMILIISKNRNGRTGEVFAKYSPDLTQFFDYDYENEIKTTDNLPY